MQNPSAQKLWNTYLEGLSDTSRVREPRVYHFYDNGEDADRSLDLVMKDIKKAYSHALLGLQLREHPLPKIGDHGIVTTWNGNAKVIVKTTSVKLLPFHSIHEEHARLEGEGDKSLRFWRKYQWTFYARELAKFGRIPKESMIVVFERFEKVFG